MDIAKWFIMKNNSVLDEGAERMTLLKLLKLLYYAEGVSLALDNGSLFAEDIVAWNHGPVVEEVWNNYNNAYEVYLNSSDSKEYEKDLSDIAKITLSDAAILEDVFNTFGGYSAWGLRNKTHEETPWLSTTKNGKIMNGIISRDLIKDYFKENYIEW